MSKPGFNENGQHTKGRVKQKLARLIADDLEFAADGMELWAGPEPAPRGQIKSGERAVDEARSQTVPTLRESSARRCLAF